MIDALSPPLRVRLTISHRRHCKSNTPMTSSSVASPPSAADVGGGAERTLGAENKETPSSTASAPSSSSSGSTSCSPSCADVAASASRSTCESVCSSICGAALARTQKTSMRSLSTSQVSPTITSECNGSPKSTRCNSSRVPCTASCVGEPIRATPIARVHGPTSACRASARTPEAAALVLDASLRSEAMRRICCTACRTVMKRAGR
mmetsp:Transcript_21488/g.49357  ORF Transcript_21488/g.49357 Transcript_21488/m.49357 type:complete len:207 (-) Transcript_21488:17-637(-)